MRFIDHWLSQLTTAISAVETNLPLPAADLERLDLGSGGEYLLTITDSADLLAQTRWEVVRLSSSGAVRGVEAQAWSAGAYIYAALNAEHMTSIDATLGSVESRVEALEQGAAPFEVFQEYGSPVDPPTGPGMWLKVGTSPYEAYVAMFIAGEVWEWQRLAMFADVTP